MNESGYCSYWFLPIHFLRSGFSSTQPLTKKLGFLSIFMWQKRGREKDITRYCITLLHKKRTVSYIGKGLKCNFILKADNVEPHKRGILICHISQNANASLSSLHRRRTVFVLLCILMEIGAREMKINLFLQFWLFLRQINLILRRQMDNWWKHR